MGNRRVGYRKYILPNSYLRGRFIPNTRTQLVPALGYPYPSASLVRIEIVVGSQTTIIHVRRNKSLTTEKISVIIVILIKSNYILIIVIRK